MSSTRRDLIQIGVGYTVAALAAAACVALVPGHPLWTVLIADLAATGVIFLCSLWYRNSSWYDPYWSVAPPLIALWLITLDGAANPVRQGLVLALVGCWAIRLTVNWAWTWRGMAQQDWRYLRLQAAAGRLWWPLSLVGIHLFPTLVVYVGCISLYPALVTGSAPLGTLDAVALAIGLAAVALEFEADRELHRFRAHRRSATELLTTGVWRWCRHPNYLGEIGFWISLFVFASAAGGGVYPWSWLGPVVMVTLFKVVSVPMIERKLIADKPAYTNYRARTFALLPLPRASPRSEP